MFNTKINSALILTFIVLTGLGFFYQNAQVSEAPTLTVIPPSELPSNSSYLLLSTILKNLMLEKGLSRSSNLDLHIKKGQVVVIDQSIDVGTLTIDNGGELHCPLNTEAISIKAKTFFIHGRFQCGAPAPGQAYKGELYLILKHSNVAMPNEADFINGNINVPPSYRGVLVEKGGVLHWNGSTARANWVKLLKTVNSGSSTIDVEGIGSWQAGDLLALAPTGYNYLESETAEIKKITLNSAPNVTPRRFIVELVTPLKYGHWGEIQKLPLNTQLDERAEVANLNRHIVVMPDESEASISDFIGAHLMIMMGGSAFIDGVEFFHMGQMGIKGRYPIHWHLAGDVNGQYIKNSSVHHSYQRCITLHGTQRAQVLNNTCYDHFGHGYFLEDGNEQNNNISGNLSILSRKPRTNRHLLQSDIDMSQFQRFAGGTGFWISHPNNIVRNNIAAGYSGTGFWMAFARGLLCNGHSCTDQCGFTPKDTTQALPACNLAPSLVDTQPDAFKNNTAHSGGVGFTWDGAPDAAQPIENNRNRDSEGKTLDRQTDSVHYSPQKTPLLKDLRAYKNISTGVYTRGQTMIFESAIFADNGWSMFFAYNTIVNNTVVIGQSLNHSNLDTEYLYGLGPNSNRARFTRKQAGIVMYDGPFELNKVKFVNFPSAQIIYNGNGPNKGNDITAVPFDTIGGARKYSNEVRGLQFSPEPYRRVYHTGFNSNPKQLSDLVGTNSLRDLDGTLTGKAGNLVLPEGSMGADESRCQSNSLWAAQICSPQHRMGRVFLSLKYDAQKTIPFLAYRQSAGKIFYHLGSDNLNLLDPLLNGTNPPAYPGQNKFAVTVGDDSTHTLFFRPEDKHYLQNQDNLVRIAYVGETINELSPIIKIAGLGAHCKMIWNGNSDYSSQPLAVTNESDLNNVKTSAYFSDARRFLIRIKAENKFHLYTKESYDLFGTSKAQSKALQTTGPAPYPGPNPNRGFALQCEQVKPYIIGSVSGAGPVSLLSGWVCDYGKKTSTSVHFYAGAPAGQGGAMIGSTTADKSSELPVSAACGSSGRKFRFTWEIPLEKRKSYAGQRLYVHGISLSNGNNNLITTNSTNPPTIQGQ